MKTILLRSARAGGFVLLQRADGSGGHRGGGETGSEMRRGRAGRIVVRSASRGRDSHSGVIVLMVVVMMDRVMVMRRTPHQRPRCLMVVVVMMTGRSDHGSRRH